MKRIIIILLTAIIILLTSCVNLEEYTPLEEYNDKVAELEVSNQIIADKDVEIIGLQEEVNTLENDLGLSKEETEKYQNLIANLNDLLKNIYYGYASNENYESDGFTAFSIKYKGEYYLITAGHCVHYKDDKIDTGVYTYFKFKANFSDEFIYPRLLAYENDYYNDRDYAVFYSDKVTSGFNYDLNNSYPKFILGTINNGLNVIRENKKAGKEGESGSPVIDIYGKVTEITTGGYVDIDLVIEAIDNLVDGLE